MPTTWQGKKAAALCPALDPGREKWPTGDSSPGTFTIALRRGERALLGRAAPLYGTTALRRGKNESSFQNGKSGFRNSPQARGKRGRPSETSRRRMAPPPPCGVFPLRPEPRGVQAGQSRRASHRLRPAPTQGSQTQRSSEAKTARPLSERRARRLKGETRMGRHAQKCRAGSKGQKAATPSPPLVMASRRIWLATAKRPTPKAITRPPRSLGARSAPTSPMITAKRRECEKPRCPKRSA